MEAGMARRAAASRTPVRQRRPGNAGLLRRSLGAFWDALAMQPRRLEEDLFQDLRYGVRMLSRNKKWTCVALISLAVGIGATTSLFSLVDAALIRRLPVRNPGELVLLNWSSGPNWMVPDFSGNCLNGKCTSFSDTIFERFRRYSRSFAEVFAFSEAEQLNVSVDGQAEITSGQFVSGNYFQGLGIAAATGRTITDADDTAAARPVAVISDRYWKNRFDRNPNAIGAAVHLNGVAFTIVGVTPPEVSGSLEIGQTHEFTLPLATEPLLRRSGSNLNESWNWWLVVMARLKSGTTVEVLRSALQGIFQQSALEGWNNRPASLRSPSQPEPSFPSLGVVPGGQGLNDTRENNFLPPVRILAVVVGLILLIVCANVANLLVARSAGRRQEIAIRLAMGASRARLVRQLLAESTLTASCGGILGIISAYWGKDLFLAGVASGAVMDLHLDLRALGFAAAITLGSAILFGAAPALRVTRKDFQQDLKRVSRLNQAILVGEIAVSTFLLIGAGLFLQTFRNLRHVELGFNPENLLLFRIDPGLNNYKSAGMVDLYQRLMQRLDAVPGVLSTTMSRHALLGGSNERPRIFIGGREQEFRESDRGYRQRVAENFFETMGIPLLTGRAFTAKDDGTAQKVAVVNEAFARRFFPGLNPIGQHFGLYAEERSRELEVVGVVADAKAAEIRIPRPPSVYTPYLQDAPTQMLFELRTMDDSSGLIPTVRQAIHDIDPNLPVFDIHTQTEQIERATSQERLFAAATTIFGIIAVVLSCIGLYAVLSCVVAQRTRELGIRTALGARRGHIIRLVMSDTFGPLVLGIAIGLTAALVVAGSISVMLFGIGGFDLLTISMAIGCMVAVGMLAGYGPSRRASRIDPMSALRSE
jgi:predicted permease